MVPQNNVQSSFQEILLNETPSRPFIDTEWPRNWAAGALIQLQAFNYPSTVVFIDKGQLKPVRSMSDTSQNVGKSSPEIASNGLRF